MIADPKADPRGAVRLLLAMRPHQWLKNLLILVPAITSHRVFQPHTIGRLVPAFLAFSLCASAGYLVNDLIDVQADRRHPLKRSRAFASGALRPRVGWAAAVLLLGAGLALGALVSPAYTAFLGAYLLLVLAYSLLFKAMLLVDVLVLASFYTFRIFAGGEAAGVPVSFWLAAFSMFFFFSLALMKRFVELRLRAGEGDLKVTGRNYRVEDLSMLGLWGAAAGCASVVVLALYIHADDVVPLYRHPACLWPVCIAVLFGLSRMWMLANRNELRSDPVVFALRDPYTYVLSGLILGALWLAL